MSPINTMIVSGVVAGFAAVTTLVSGTVFKRAFDSYHQARTPTAIALTSKASAQKTRSVALPPSLDKSPEERLREQLERAQLNEIQERQANQRRAEKAADVEEKRQAENRKRLEETNKATSAIDRLRFQYRTEHGFQDPNTQVPDEWVNFRLRQERIPYIYHGNENGSYTASPASPSG